VLDQALDGRVHTLTVATSAGGRPIAIHRSGDTDLDGWEVADESASNRDGFDELRLDPGRSVTLFSGCGTDDDARRYWCASGSVVWNSSGDTVFLRDRRGNSVVSVSYGDSP
jgi:hypothetical protein